MPLADVVVPERLSFTITETFATGFPSVSVTLPVITVFWAKALSGKIVIHTKMGNNLVLNDAENDISNRLCELTSKIRNWH